MESSHVNVGQRDTALLSLLECVPLESDGEIARIESCDVCVEYECFSRPRRFSDEDLESLAVRVSIDTISILLHTCGGRASYPVGLLSRVVGGPIAAMVDQFSSTELRS